MFTTFGDMFINFYFKNHILEGISLGKSNNIILANLSTYYETKVLGVIGNNKLANVAISDLDKLGIKHDKLKVIDEDIKGLFIDDGISDICPYCNRKYSYDESRIDMDDVLNNIDPKDKIIIDNLSDETIEILNNIDNDIYLDLGTISSIKYLSLDELEDIDTNFKIISIDIKVYNYLKKKFKIDSRDLFNIFNPEILIIYNGIQGCDIVTSDDITHKDMEGKVVLDSTGTREVFFAEFIHEYLSYESIDDKVLSNIFIKSFSKLIYVANHYGALTHLIPMNIIKNYTECICKEIDI